MSVWWALKPSEGFCPSSMGGSRTWEFQYRARLSTYHNVSLFINPAMHTYRSLARSGYSAVNINSIYTCTRIDYRWSRILHLKTQKARCNKYRGKKVEKDVTEHRSEKYVICMPCLQKISRESQLIRLDRNGDAPPRWSHFLITRVQPRTFI